MSSADRLDWQIAEDLVSCRRNNMPFVAIKMGRRQGVRREHI
jgi:hypothetical protein